MRTSGGSKATTATVREIVRETLLAMLGFQKRHHEIASSFVRKVDEAKREQIASRLRMKSNV